MSKTNLAEKENTSVGNVINYESDAGAGFEGADDQSYAIPFLSILQSGSPQCKKSEGAYIKGAEEGMLFNSVTQEIFAGDGEGLTVIPCHFKRSFIKWGPRDSGEGFKGEFKVSDPFVTGVISKNATNDKGQLVDEEENIMADTRTHYALVLKADGTFTPCVVSFASTQIKKSRNWMSKMNGLKMQRVSDKQLYTPPMFSHRYRLTTTPEHNDKGSWFGWKIELIGPVEDANLYHAAKDFRDAVVRGEVKEQQPQAATSDDYTGRDGEY